MLSQLLERKKKSKAKTLSKKSKGKGRKGKARLLHIPRRRSSLTPSRPSFHPKRNAIQRMRALILKG